MSYVLFLIVLNSYNSRIPVSTSTTTFTSESTCLQAISKLLDMEGSGIKIKARCVRQ